MESDQHQFGVIGAGAWGTAIARHLSIKGYPVRIWCNETKTADSIIKDRVNSVFLPDILLPETLDATTDPLNITRHARIFLAAPPSQFPRELARIIKPDITPAHHLVIHTQGIEPNLFVLMCPI